MLYVHASRADVVVVLKFSSCMDQSELVSVFADCPSACLRASKACWTYYIIPLSQSRLLLPSALVQRTAWGTSSGRGRVWTFRTRLESLRSTWLLEMGRQLPLLVVHLCWLSHCMVVYVVCVSVRQFAILECEHDATKIWALCYENLSIVSWESEHCAILEFG